MFENLAERLQQTFANLTRKGKLDEKDVEQAMREIRLALLEADVSYKVVKDFVARTKEKAIGENVMKSLTPGQMVVKIVKEQLIDLMSDPDQSLRYSSNAPTIILMCGLQGAGKTTHAAKLARLYLKKGKRPLLVACDVYRPAAIKQLQVVGEQAGAPVFEMGTDVNPVTIAQKAVEDARRTGKDPVIIDTAGRLQIDEALMEELREMKAHIPVTETLLVVDAMTGQEAVNVAKAFNEQIDLTGVVLSKMDGDARGGAALSVRAVTQKPIKLVGTGEKLDDLEEFHPDRLVGRILGMGDVLTLIEKAEQTIDKEQAKEMEKKLRSQKYDLNDFYSQIQQMKKLGPLENLLTMIPGINAKMLDNVNLDGKQIAHMEAIITSMTPEERANPDKINPSRRTRIAKGSGVDPVLVNRMLKQFKDSKKMMKQVTKLQKKGKKGFFKNPFFK
ncbi:MAG: signal recognition particle protein [Peptoniphilaceae bacterium]|nr:signal recognition particle protein [Peptoniphilaceae bacterium]MDD7433578.1 signal recognition particle protein [Peptoniphilaceae bacterium]MDY3076043.1 signal recognition particle protein [Peptoniphilaceae bacterium]MDY3987479.1 signal recognition particle protein [Peptoniphilaceae bacterium]MDY4196865.1 signal recognition particle protein [Peptoniphilaceae bacterium]